MFADLAYVGADIIDLDFMNSPAEARAVMGAAQVLVGNIDPVRVLRDTTPEGVQVAVAECHHQAGGRYIVGAGCEVPPDTPEANMLAMTRYACEHEPAASAARG